MGRKVISVSFDLGSDTTKAAYSFLNEKGDYVCKLLFDHGEGIPSMAYYDSEKENWIFDKKDILQRAQSSFCYLVKVKELLDLFFTRAEDRLYTDHYFKTFYYPPKASETYADAVRNGRSFVAAETPREVCALFVKYCVGKIEEEIRSRFTVDVAIRYVVVYPANASKEYIKELIAFVTAAATMMTDLVIISAPRAVGLAAKEYGVVSKEKNVLLFNIGEEEISVVKMHFDRSNISVYGADGHSSPAKIGGKNIDLALAEHLFERSSTIKSFGNTVGQEVEKGMFYDQFRMQEGIKSGKRIFSNGEAYQRLGGFVFSVYREMITTVKILQHEFEACCCGVFTSIWKYVRKEIEEGDNDDVDAVIFSGGGADTYGLDKYIKGKLEDEFPEISFLDFSPENEDTGYDDILCAAKDTVPIGAALYGAGKYAFKLLTTMAYGTYRGSKNEESSKYAFDPFVPKGMEIDLVGKPDFKVEYMAANPLYSKPKMRKGRVLLFNEYYKCATPKGFDIKNDSIVFRDYTPERDFRKGSAAKSSAFSGICFVKGRKSEVTLKRIGCYLMVYSFPSSFKGDRERMAQCVYFVEGFSVDFEGRVTPIVRNASHEYYVSKNKLAEYDKLYQEVKLTLEPNGTDVMSINN